MKNRAAGGLIFEQRKRGLQQASKWQLELVDNVDVFVCVADATLQCTG